MLQYSNWEDECWYLTISCTRNLPTEQEQVSLADTAVFRAGPLPAELGRLRHLADLHTLGGCTSYSLPLLRGFTR